MAENSNDNENISIELIRSMVINESLSILSLDYPICEERLIYNKE